MNFMPRNVDFLITRIWGRPIADERLAFEFLFDDTFVVAWARKVHGLGGEGSSLPNW